MYLLARLLVSMALTIQLLRAVDVRAARLVASIESALAIFLPELRKTLKVRETGLRQASAIREDSPGLEVEEVVRVGGHTDCGTCRSVVFLDIRSRSADDWRYPR
jgi:hypothetical protein